MLSLFGELRAGFPDAGHCGGREYEQRNGGHGQIGGQPQTGQFPQAQQDEGECGKRDADVEHAFQLMLNYLIAEQRRPA